MKFETKIGIGIMVALIILGLLLNQMAKDEIIHIETVSKKCAEKGKGITPAYMKTGDKYWVCEK